MDRRPTAAVFRERLSRLLDEHGASPSAFARQVGIDRSTLSQLLTADNDRLPRAETLVAIAVQHRVSVDYLLGLSAKGQVGADIVEEPLQVEAQAMSPVDDRIFRWHSEAAGQRIRTVPLSFPDFLKTEEVIHFEYQQWLTTGPERTVANAQERLAYLRRPEVELEACTACQHLTAFAHAEGRWAGLPREVRLAQLAQLAALADELYPRVRLFLYDLRQTFSVPFVVFGPRRAVVYLGQMYFVFNSSEHIRVLGRRFDEILRAAVVQPPDLPRWLRALAAEVA